MCTKITFKIPHTHKPKIEIFSLTLYLSFHLQNYFMGYHITQEANFVYFCPVRVCMLNVCNFIYLKHFCYIIILNPTERQSLALPCVVNTLS